MGSRIVWKGSEGSLGRERRLGSEGSVESEGNLWREGSPGSKGILESEGSQGSGSLGFTPKAPLALRAP